MTVRKDNQRDMDALRLAEAALEPQSGDQPSCVEQMAKGDDGLLDRVMVMLDADATGGGVELTGRTIDALSEEIDHPMPERLGQYRLISLIERRSMGPAYLGVRDVGDFDHKATITVLRGLKTDAKSKDRLKQYGLALSRLKHLGIAQLFDGGETIGGDHFLVTEYVDGVSLGDLAAQRHLSKTQLLAIFAEICSVVQYAHQNLVVHRNLSPSAIMVTRNNSIKLINFGVPPSLFLVQAGGGATQRYAAPEQAAGEPATTLGDIFSLGMILHELMVSSGVDVDEELRAICAQACAVEPAARYPSVSALQADVGRYSASEPVIAYGGGAGYKMRKWVQRRPAYSAASALVFVGTFLALAVMALQYTLANGPETDGFERVRAGVQDELSAY